MAFEWLKDYQARAAQKRRQQQPVNYAQTPVSMRHGAMGHTGFGADGQLQPNNPTSINPNGVVEHEGEVAVPGPGGRYMMSAPTSRAMMGPGGAAPNGQQPPGAPQQMPPTKDLERQQGQGLPGRGQGMGGGYQPPTTAPTAQQPPGAEQTPTAPQQRQMKGAERRYGLPGRRSGGFSEIRGSNPAADAAQGAVGALNQVVEDAPQIYADAKNNFIKPEATAMPAPGLPTPEAVTNTPESTLAGSGAPASGISLMAQTAQQGAVGSSPDVGAPTPEPILSDEPIDEEAGDGAGDPTDLYRSGAMGRMADIMRGGDPALRAEGDRQLGDQQATHATEDMVAAQQAAQGGLDPSVAAGRAAMSDRTQSGAEADLRADIATADMQAQQRATESLHGMAVSDARFALDREKYGDQEFGRMVDDIANGMSFEDAQAKYPNLTRESYDRVEDIALFEQNQVRRQVAGDATASYVDQQIAVDPNYVASGAWMDDPVMTQRLSTQWSADGMEGDYNPENLAHQSWAQGQVTSYTMSDAEIAANQVRSSPWYQELDPAKQDEIDELLEFSTELSVTGGFSLNDNEDGSTYITNGDGDVVYGTRGPSSDGGGVTSDQADDFIEHLADQGVTVSTNRARQYINEHPGEPYPSVEDYNSWDVNAGNMATVQSWLAGDDDVVLRSGDTRMIEDIFAAQQAVNAGTATDEQKTLAASVPETFVNDTIWGEDNPSVGFTSGEPWTTPESRISSADTPWGVGAVHLSITGNRDIYNLDARQGSNGGDAYFLPTVRTWIEENAGNIVNIDGNYYRISGSNPIVRADITGGKVGGKQAWEPTWQVDGMNVINLQTGQPEIMRFGLEATARD